MDIVSDAWQIPKNYRTGHYSIFYGGIGTWSVPDAYVLTWVRIKACSRNQHNTRHRRSIALCQKESINFDQSMRGLMKSNLCFGSGPACGSRSSHIMKQALLYRTKERDQGVEKAEAKIRLYYRAGHYYGWLVLNSTKFSEQVMKGISELYFQ